MVPQKLKKCLRTFFFSSPFVLKTVLAPFRIFLFEFLWIKTSFLQLQSRHLGPGLLSNRATYHRTHTWNCTLSNFEVHSTVRDLRHHVSLDRVQFQYRPPLDSLQFQRTHHYGPIRKVLCKSKIARFCTSDFKITNFLRALFVFFVFRITNWIFLSGSISEALSWPLRLKTLPLNSRPLICRWASTKYFFFAIFHFLFA